MSITINEPELIRKSKDVFDKFVFVNDDVVDSEGIIYDSDLIS